MTWPRSWSTWPAPRVGEPQRTGSDGRPDQHQGLEHHPQQLPECGGRAYARKLLSGDENGNFNGAASTTRAQAAVVLCSLYDASTTIQVPTYVAIGDVLQIDDPRRPLRQARVENAIAYRRRRLPTLRSPASERDEARERGFFAVCARFDAR